MRQMRNGHLALALLLCCPALSLAQGEPRTSTAPSDANGEVKKVQQATSVFREVMGMPDKAVPKAILDKAVGIAVFPGVLKAAFGFGAQWGYGVLSVKDAATGNWSRPAFLKLKGGSWGAQLGGQSIDLVLVVMNRRGLDDLMKNEFKIGGEAQAAAGPVGRSAEAGTDIQLHAEILSYSRSRGLFAGVSLSGTSIHEDTDANARFYGREMHTEQVVNMPGAKGNAPAVVAEWRNTLDRYVTGAVATSGKKDIK